MFEFILINCIKKGKDATSASNPVIARSYCPQVQAPEQPQLDWGFGIPAVMYFGSNPLMFMSVFWKAYSNANRLHLI